MSLVLCASSATIFIRSEFVSEGYLKLHFDQTAKQYTATILGWSNGRIICDRTITQFPSSWDNLFASFPQTKPHDSAGYDRLSTISPSDSDAGKWLWLSLHQNDFGFTVHSLLIFLLSSILPFIWAKRFIGAYRVQRIGSCRICGYDLRATPDRCPECGTVPKKRVEFQTTKPQQIKDLPPPLD